jgi:hypothetical protein
VYGVLDGAFFLINPAMMRMAILRDKNASLLAMNRQGRLYFRDPVTWWRHPR